MIDLMIVVDVFVLFSGFEFIKNLDAIQHKAVFALFSGFELNAILKNHPSLRESSLLDLLRGLCFGDVHPTKA